jgi:UDP-glucose 4-epimerase
LRVLVTGGAGYIGSAVGDLLASEGHDVVVLDDLSTGHAEAVPDAVRFVTGSITSNAREVLVGGIDAVLHFAGKALVGESVADPVRYWQHNLGGSLALLEAMRATGTRRIVFSSTCAVYGEPEHVPVDESVPPRPISPYGASKLAVDVALAEFARLHGIGGVSLRYFNVAGAHRGRDGRWFGERHKPETHLIPNILAVAAQLSGTGAAVRIFGNDYPTPDGTCVRDYIHVTDLARAHLLALDTCTPGEHRVYNLGSGAGFSNGEVLAICREVTGHELPTQMEPRRPGDPPVLVASSDRIRAELGWLPDRGLRSMVADAWTFIRTQSR